jgi:hypothetical protein
MLVIGRLLNEAKELIDHGDWLPFLKLYRIEVRSAQRYMSAAAWVSKSDTVTHFDLSRVAPRAIYALASGRCAESVVPQVLQAACDRHVSEADVREIAQAGAEATLLQEIRAAHDDELARADGCADAMESAYDDQSERAQAATPRELSDNPWRDLNDQALANLDKWVPALDLYKWRRKSNGGFEAVAHWRQSSTGQPLERRERHLKIDRKGIVDFGDVTYTPIDLVMAATKCERDAAASWLDERIGFVAPPQQGNVVDLHGNPIKRQAPKIIIAKPYVRRDPKTIPPRRWLYGRHLARGYTSVTFAPGAGCKTSLTLLEVVEMVTAVDLSKTGQAASADTAIPPARNRKPYSSIVAPWGTI